MITYLWSAGHESLTLQIFTSTRRIGLIRETLAGTGGLRLSQMV